MDVTTPRLILHPIDLDEGRRIAARRPGDGDRWAEDYPFDGDLAGVGAFLRAWDRHGEQRPFGYYQLRRREDGTAIGGIGFKGPPAEGVAEVGYGLAPSARGAGRATEALQAVVAIAADLGVAVLRADVEPGNTASRRVLEKAGFAQVGEDAGAVLFERGTGSRLGAS